jgi:predicted dehydrogenase
MSDDINRRDFMKRAALSTAAVSISMAGLSTTRVLGANDRLRLGVIGTGRQGIDNMQHFIRQGVEAAAVSDCYEPNLQNGLRAAGGKAKTYTDFRKLIDDKSLDIVMVATPDHWHALQTVMACQAGKDVYAEKPICVAIEEGKKMVEAARKHKRVVQVGLWQRSNAHFQAAAKAVQDGVLGKVTYVRTWNYSNIFPDGIGNVPDGDPPPGLDWDMWLGPAPKRPYNWNRFGVGDRWSTFRYFYDYANGWPGDWAVHLLDIVQWAMKVTGPTAVTATGSKFVVKDNADIPDTLDVTYEFPGFVCTYENRLANSNSLFGKGYGIVFHGTDATMFLDRDGYEIYPENTASARANQKLQLAEKKVKRTDDGLANHVTNMLECIKSRQRPANDIEDGHHSSTTALLANVALLSKRRIVWDPAAQKLVEGGPEAEKLLSREYRAPWKLEV